MGKQDRRREHQRRYSTAAKRRFLVMPDGRIWMRQAGIRPLKSKKKPQTLKRMQKLVMITPRMHKRVWQTLGKRPPALKAEDFIMRKFNQQRWRDHLGTSDHGTGTALALARLGLSRPMPEGLPRVCRPGDSRP